MKVLTISFFFCVLISFAGISQEDCCPNTAIYGDDQNNESSIIKHYDGSNYLIAYSKIDGDYHPTFTKFDGQFNILFQIAFNYEAILYDFVKADDGGFFLVGRSLGEDNNKSLLIKVSSTGDIIFARFYDVMARESFLKIIRHTNPIDSAFPYYISGAASPNTLSDPLTEENVFLYNMNNNGDFKWTKKYNYTQVDQFATSMIPKTDGGIVLLGNVLPMTAFALKLDPNGNPIIASKSDGFRYLDGVELNDGKLAMVGYKDESNDLAMLFSLDENMTVLSATNLGEEFETFYHVKKDNEGNIYVPGAYETDQSVILKCALESNNITVSQSRYFDYGESRFYEPSLDVQGSKVYVADIRKKNPKAFGKRDVVLGTFSTNLDESCLKDFNVTTSYPNIISETINTVTSENASIPVPDENNNASTLTFESKPICIPVEDCTNGIDDDGDGLIDFLDPDCQCESSNVIEHVPNSGFEERTDCCKQLIEGCVKNWKDIGGTTDYFSPDCLTEVELQEYSDLYGIPISDAAIHFGAGADIMESFGVCLDQSLAKDETYTLSFDIYKKNVTDPSNMNPISGYIHIYGWKECGKLYSYAATSSDCFNSTGITNAVKIYTIDLGSFDLAKWKTIKKSIIAPSDIAAISIEIDCNDGGVQCTGFPFFLMDNISIKKLGWEYEDTIVVKDDLCDDSFYLAVKDSADLKYQWYKDGTPIANADSSAYLFDKSTESMGGLFQVVIFNSDSCFITEEYQLQYVESKNTELNELICPGDSVYFGGKWRLNAGFYTDKLTASNGCDSTVTLNLGFDTNPDCAVEEDCTNGIDDDGDGLIDYLDPDCQCDPNKVIEHVPNSGFEERTDCCAVLEDGCVHDWFNIFPSSDYYHPECLEEEQLNNIESKYQISISDGVIHLWGTNQFIESFGVCLEQPLINTETYNLTFDFLKKNLDDPTNMNPLTGYINIYGWNTCEYLKNYASSSPLCFNSDTTTNAEVIYTIDLSSFNQAEWQSIQHIFTPTDKIGAISIAVTCNDGGVQTSGTPGFLIDNISIKPQGVVSTPEYDIIVEGSLCDDSFLLVTKDSADYSYQWYKDNEVLVGANSSSFMFDKNTGHTDGLFKVAIITPEGCSIVDSIEVQTQNSITEEISESICSGDSIFFGGKWWFEAGNYTAVYQTAQGCDSTSILHLEVEANILKEAQFSICPDQTLSFGNVELTEAGVYQINVPGISSCDTMYTVTLNVFPKTNVNESAEICEGEIYTFKGVDFNKNGTYFIDYENQYGCMTIDTLKLTVNPVFAQSEEQTICAGDTFFYKGTPLFKEDLYTFNEQTLEGCDSIVNIQINVLEQSNSSEDVTICKGEVYTHNGIEYSEQGNYEISLQSINGCDSLHTIHLEVVDTIKTFENKMLCSGESYVVDGNELTTSGLYQYYYKSQAGCDSLFAIELSFVDPVKTSDAVEICDNEYYVQGNDTLRVDGRYEYNYSNINGCDSTHTIDLKVYETFDSSTKEVEIKEGEFVVFGGDTLYQEGNYSHVYNTTNGCDSVEYLELRVKRIKNDVFVPNIFSPNNDGVNDLFQIYANGDLGMKIEELSIFDRWGNRIFIEKSIDENWKGWDGRFKGSKVVAGVYVYLLTYKDFRGIQYKRTGSITIVH